MQEQISAPSSVSIALAGSGGSGVMTAGTVLLAAAAKAGAYGVMVRTSGPQIRGGEAAALVMLEAVVRLMPDVMGNPLSPKDDSHSPDNMGRLEGPSYTRPPVWRGLTVPEVLLSGDHGRVAAWRREQAMERTRERRPDLLGGGDG